MGIILLVVFLIKDDFSSDETDKVVNILIPLLVIIMFIPMRKLIDLASKKRVLNLDEFQLKIKKQEQFIVLTDRQFKNKINLEGEPYEKMKLREHFTIELSYFSKELLSLDQNKNDLLKITEHELEALIEHEAKEDGWKLFTVFII